MIPASGVRGAHGIEPGSGLSANCVVRDADN